MKKLIGSPLVRISIGLVMLTCSILLMFEFMGLVPETKSLELKYRKTLVETLAVQLNSDISADRQDNIYTILKALVTRNDEVISAAVRKVSERSITQFGEHQRNWALKPTDKSTTSQIQVPIYKNDKRWATIEVSFDELPATKNSFYLLVLFVALSGFFCYLFFLKRTMIELDPSTVVPERVRNALNTLSDGLLIIDNKEQIIFSNDPFLQKSALSSKSVLGKKASSLDWFQHEQRKDVLLPWLAIINGEPASTGSELRLRSKSGKYISYKVNASPIGATGKLARGVLVTFNDITELESKNHELGQMLDKLKLGQKEIAAQNKELQYLATRDPLTGCLNRRSFFDGLRELINEEKKQENSLTCIMLDIDHFKSVNDNYGHALGDKVIKMVAAKLKEISRTNDLVGRYGGEEFCVVLPHTSAEIAAQVAERIRVSIMETVIPVGNSKLNITSSFGIARWTNSLSNAEALVSRADEALYVAKESGRNRVEIWCDNEEETDEHKTDEHKQSKAQVTPLTNLAPNTDKTLVEAITDKCLDNENVHPLAAKQPNKLIFDDEFQSLEAETDVEPTSLAFGFPSRTVMLDRITQSIYRADRNKTKCALFVLDLEKARQIHNTMGYAVSEKFISEMAKKISDKFRNTDCLSLIDIEESSFCLSQISSYEFALLMTDFEQGEVINKMLSRVFIALDEVTIVEGNELYLDSSIGISVYPTDGKDPDELISHASTAMQEAKLMTGKHRFKYYSAEIHKRSNQQLKMESDLRRAVERDEFVVYYQPKIDLRTGNICGMEALVRWLHPELGILAPAYFITLAESNGLIESITQKVMVMVCHHLKSWQEEGLATVPIAINLSQVVFRNKQLASQLLNIVAEAGLSPADIELELTENIAMNNLHDRATLLQELSDHGFSIALDNFGTGYCSYNYLKYFPVDKIKIDRSIVSDFTENVFDAAIVNSIIALAEHLELTAIAEGVETVEQLTFLRDLNCHQVQGYFISIPLAFEDISKHLSDPTLITQRIQLALEDEYNSTTKASSTDTELIGLLNEFN